MRWRHFCDDTSRRCLSHVDDPAGHRDSSAGRGATDLAVQQRLGLLPERRTGSGPPDPAHPGADRPRVAASSIGGSRGVTALPGRPERRGVGAISGPHILSAKSRSAPGPPGRDERRGGSGAISAPHIRGERGGRAGGPGGGAGGGGVGGAFGGPNIPGAKWGGARGPRGGDELWGVGGAFWGPPM